ncbi:hypothetical protein [Bacillus sp. ISL-77]|uniref:hypothetical protein n=1 Tax=Bacillus sp. ISL-77 TaxID=2819138 RepID=UPI001BE7EFA0|nr:hypothetical protein [Bacillus sp. ISL-77]MBT2740983.1 hypothetical protein [Bacillus sp. ISL-77]
MDTKSEACLTNEAILIQSVICSNKVKLIAHVNTSIKKVKGKNIQFVPDLSSIKITGTLLKDLIVIQGFIKGMVIVDGKCVKKITLSFQEEVICEGACPGDTLKLTTPFLEGILPPQVIPQETHGVSGVVFKVILKVQATVVRDKIGMVSINIIGDINEDRCQPPAHPTSVIFCEREKHPHEDDHCDHEESNDDFPCFVDESCEDSDKW